MDAVKTYRYLRLALIGMAVLIGGGVLHEWWATGWHCLQPSLSDYYYTPARGALVGALVAIGVSMVVIKGNTDWEDVLLNLAGAAAPIIAFVPTTPSNVCSSAPEGSGDIPAGVANNVFALLVLLFAVLLATIVLAVRSPRAGRGLRSPAVAGVVAATVLYLATVAAFVWARATFLAHAHYAAATVLFLCMVAVVMINASSVARQRAPDGAVTVSNYVNPYAVIAVVMVGSVLLMLGWRAAFGWEHALLWIEIVLVASFAAFWAMQTRELWHVGIRSGGATGGSERSRRPPA